MPIIKSAKKRVRIAKKATIRNAKTKRSLKEAVKTFTKSLGSNKAADAHKKAQGAIDQAVKKNLMHKNKAARKKRQLAAAAKKAGVSTKATAKSPAKKVAKKPVAKKKPAAKK